ncbi:Crp/Fnr family transcriptional regulator [Ornithinibacillus halotolerans]|uniref:Anaerobic regulatory protein n=1 Tax=Ornithinibacillus halotolerans TaxID=1274357 RepID=A0A916W7S0_9BACI|nr:Crp/Fnr family transcriptional regulator [Ornithinibacillus halotolerans]GGA74671.1 anaerobic regulatory protein [Ornithinibacillus halotolerans]
MLSSLMLGANNSANISISNELRELLDSISTTKKVMKNAFIFHEGLEANEIYIVNTGLVQVSKLTADGKELILRICNRDDIVGELSLFSDDPKYLLSGKALTDAEIQVVQKDQLEDALLSNGNLTFEYMRWSSTQMRKFQSKIRDLLLNGKKGALYSTLIRLANSYGLEQDDGTLINVSLTNQELANFCAATRESINRMLVHLRKIDVITIDKTGRIFIKDLDYLKTEIGCEGCPIEICNIN